MRSKYVDVGGVAVNYLHSGPSTLPDTVPGFEAGELILFLHDAGGNANLWRRQIEALDGEHSALAMDFPGHGRSGATDGLSSLAALAEFIASFAEATALRPFVLVGKGLGAAAAVEYSASHRKQVRGLVLIGCASRVEIDDAVLREWQEVGLGRRPQSFSKDEFASATSLDVMREVWMEQVKTDPRVRYTDLSLWGDIDLSDRLGDVRQPVLVVAGAEDRVVAPDRQQDLCPQLPNSRMEVIDDAGHAVEVEQADAVADRIRAFVTSLARDVPL